MKQHTEDYKQTAVQYYLDNDENLRDVCNIFKCEFQSLARWVKTYKKQGNIYRKTRKNHNLKITPEIEQFVKLYVRNYNTTTLWELSKLVNKKPPRLKGGFLKLHNIITLFLCNESPQLFFATDQFGL